MKKSGKYYPTDPEVEILQVLWEHGPSAVRLVNEALNQGRSKALGYTTTLKQMQRMYESGMLTRIQEGKSHVYQAAIRESEVQHRLLNRLVDTAFKGSALDMALHALGQADVSSDELAQLQDWLEAKKKEGGKS